MLADWKSDLAEIAGDFPSVLIFSGVEVLCTASDLTEDVLINERGEYDPQSKDVLCSISAFTNGLPQERNTVVLDGTKFYVQEREVDSNTDTIRLSLKRI